MTDHKQYDLVFSHGQFLTYHLEENKRYALYAINKFFVEIEYDVINNHIVNKVSFKSGKKLDRYSRIFGNYFF